MKLISSILAALSIVFTAQLVSADSFYKWTDENGVVHYSQRAPKNQEAETITTKTAPSSAPANNTTNTASNSNTEAEEESEETAETAPAPQTVQKDAATCEKAKKNLQVLTSRPIVRRDGKVMTIEQKNKEIQNLNEIISVHC